MRVSLVLLYLSAGTVPTICDREPRMAILTFTVSQLWTAFVYPSIDLWNDSPPQTPPPLPDPVFSFILHLWNQSFSCLYKFNEEKQFNKFI